MKVLLTNDDGIHAAGLQAIKRTLRRSMDVVVVAPEVEQSECGHSVTTKRPLRVIQHGEAEFSVDGKPADCVRLGLLELAKDATLVVAGINHGGNLGADTWMSGTVAAAREGFLRGRNAIAVSQVRRREIADNWDQSAKFASEAVHLAMQWSEETIQLWNINLPATKSSRTPKIQRCEVDLTALPMEFLKTDQGYTYQGNYHGRPRTLNYDVDVCFRGQISVSLLG